MQITPDKNLQFYFTGYKLLLRFSISVFGLIFAALFVFADTSSGIAAKVMPTFLLTVFGVSTLTSLARFVQIDRALISPLSSNPEQFKLIKTIVDMAHGLGIEALAEGVETEDTINKLRMLGVNYVQGYAFSKPMNIVDLQGFLVRKSA